LTFNKYPDDCKSKRRSIRRWQNPDISLGFKQIGLPLAWPIPAVCRARRMLAAAAILRIV
jgi:hypothetical protein